MAQVRSWCLVQDLVAGTVRAINLENMVEEELAGLDYGLAVLVGGVGEGSGMPGLPLDEWCPRDTRPQAEEGVWMGAGPEGPAPWGLECWRKSCTGGSGLGAASILVAEALGMDVGPQGQVHAPGNKNVQVQALEKAGCSTDPGPGSPGSRPSPTTLPAGHRAAYFSVPRSSHLRNASGDACVTAAFPGVWALLSASYVPSCVLSSWRVEAQECEGM